jgi:FKBP-type peptidyl-prolyl cis-trans isomerase (trigger factor)
MDQTLEKSIGQIIEQEKYKNVCLHSKPTDKRALEDAVQAVLVAQLAGEVPGEMVENKLQSLVAQGKMAVNANPVYYVLADIIYFLDRGFKAAQIVRMPDQIRSEALEIMLALTKDKKNASKEYVYSLLKERIQEHGTLPAEFEATLTAIVAERKQVVAQKSNEERLDEAFAAYLGTLNQTEEVWKNNRRTQAVDLVKCDFLYDAVAKQEQLMATDQEITAMLEQIARACHISLEDIEKRIDSATLGGQISRDKAKAFILQHVTK